MIRVPSKQNKKSSKVKIRPNVMYFAKVTGVEWSPGFREGHAIDVKYKINVDGELASHKETFFVIDELNERVQRFNDLLDAVGAKTYEDYIGTELNVVFQYEVKKHGKHLNIVEYHVGGKADGRETEDHA